MTASCRLGAGGLAMCVATLVLALAVPAAAHAGGEDHPGRGHPRHHRDDDRDPLPGIVRRIDRFMQLNESDGVVMDARYVINPTEAARLSVVSQLLAYTELYKVVPSPRLRSDIT